MAKFQKPEREWRTKPEELKPAPWAADAFQLLRECEDPESREFWVQQIPDYKFFNGMGSTRDSTMSYLRDRRDEPEFAARILEGVLRGETKGLLSLLQGIRNEDVRFQVVLAAKHLLRHHNNHTGVYPSVVYDPPILERIKNRLTDPFQMVSINLSRAFLGTTCPQERGLLLELVQSVAPDKRYDSCGEFVGAAVLPLLAPPWPRDAEVDKEAIRSKLFHIMLRSTSFGQRNAIRSAFDSISHETRHYVTDAIKKVRRRTLRETVYHIAREYQEKSKLAALRESLFHKEEYKFMLDGIPNPRSGKSWTSRSAILREPPGSKVSR